jgi:Ca2+-binding EF-hand superfamily protein
VALAPVAEAVASLDVNGDGFITVDELLKRAAEEGVTLSREQAEEFIQVCDELSAGKGLCNVGVRTSALVCSSAD